MITSVKNLGISESEDELFGHRNYTWRWLIEVDDAQEDANLVAQDSRFIQKGFPLIASEFSDPRAVLVKTRVSKKDDDPRIVFLTQQFSTNIKFPSSAGDAGSNSGPGSGGNGVTPATWPDNPLLQPPSIRGYFIREMEPIEEDLRPEALGGPQPVVNTLGEPLVPPIELPRKYPAIAISINKATIDEDFLTALQDAVNSDPWRNYPAGQVKHECEWHSEFDQQFGAYWRVDCVFVINFRGWNPTSYLNTSFNQKVADPATGRYRRAPIRDKYGQPTATAQPIDADGNVLTPPVIRTGTLTSGSAIITGLSATDDIDVGDEVRGVGIPHDAQGNPPLIESIDSATQITISDTATEDGAQTLTIGAPYHWLDFWLHPTEAFGGWPF